MAIIINPITQNRNLPSEEEQIKYFHRALMGRTMVVALSSIFRSESSHGNPGVKRTWFNRIEYTQEANAKTLYLGMIPDNLQKRGIPSNIHAVSIVQDFEARCMDSSISRRTIVNSVDNVGMDPQQISEGVKALTGAMHSASAAVYLHCKSGVGRSATVLAAWLIVTQGLSLERAIDVVQRDRPDAQLREPSGKSTKHTVALSAWYQQAHSEMKEIP